MSTVILKNPYVGLLMELMEESKSIEEVEYCYFKINMFGISECVDFDNEKVSICLYVSAVLRTI